jgi:hypothetical protein
MSERRAPYHTPRRRPLEPQAPLRRLAAELWRVRVSLQAAQELREAAALAARASIEKGSTMSSNDDVWRSVERDGDRQLRRKGRDLADAARHVKDQLGSLARISDADESRRGLVRRALSQAGDLTTTLDALAGEGPA